VNHRHNGVRYILEQSFLMFRIHRQKPAQAITETGSVAEKEEQAEQNEKNVGNKEKKILRRPRYLRHYDA
jgi:ribosomal protein L21E